MPIRLKQGQGEGTEYKERRLGAAFKINLDISRSKNLIDRPYFHFDLHAGSGYNEKSNCIGSPLAFLRAVEKTQRTNFYAHFVEKDEKSCYLLEQRIKETTPFYDRCFIHNGDNFDFVDTIPNLIRLRNQDPRRAIGTILLDPNGHTAPWRKVGKLGELCEKLDVIANYNISISKRMSGIDACRCKLVRLEDIPVLVNKKHALISAPVGGGNKFVLVICRNMATKSDHKKMEIYFWDSPQGRAIRYEAGYSLKEKKEMNQGGLL